MPIYEYQCESCGHRQDALQRISDDPLVDCAACGQPQLRKLVSAPRFRLKGSGWYETDFKTGDKRNLADGADAGKADGAKAAGSDGGASGGDAAKSGDGARKSEGAAKSDSAGGKKSGGASESGGKPSSSAA